MHELGIAIEIHRACLTELAAHGGGRLAAVSVAVGELSGVEPDLLQYAWQGLFPPGTEAPQLTIDWTRAEQLCPDCGVVAERQPGSWLRLCPHCTRPLRVRGGQELELRELGIDTPAVSAPPAPTPPVRTPPVSTEVSP